MIQEIDYMKIPFDKLGEADLVIDTIYEGGKISGKASEVLSKIFEIKDCFLCPKRLS